MEMECIRHPPILARPSANGFRRISGDQGSVAGTEIRKFGRTHRADPADHITFDEQWYKDVFTKWVRRHGKCVKEHGVYFEKT